VWGAFLHMPLLSLMRLNFSTPNSRLFALYTCPPASAKAGQPRNTLNKQIKREEFGATDGH
jgi:hypothetical protein